MECVVEPEVVPIRHVFISIAGWEIEEKVEEYSKNGYCTSPITYLKNYLSATKMNFEKPPAGAGARGWIQNSPESARLCFHFCTRNRGKCASQTYHNDAPAKIVNNHLSLGFHQQLFAYAFLTSPANWKTKKPASRNKMSIKFYILQWTVENVITNSMMTPWQKKRAACFCVIYRSIFNKSARCISVLRATYVLLKLELFSTQLYSSTIIRAI